jgi:hypothetical protein
MKVADLHWSKHHDDRHLYDVTNTSATTHASNKKYVIPVFFHVLAYSRNYGQLTNTQVRQYVQTLNDRYASTTAFSFVLRGIRRRTGAEWYNCVVNNDGSWKQGLQVAGSNALNIYMCQPTITVFNNNNTVAESLQGISTFPTQVGDVRDGVILAHPDVYGPLASLMSVVHEVGHVRFSLSFANCVV